MRRISVVRHRGYGGQPPIAFSQRRQAERYIENLVKQSWKASIDLETLGTSWAERIRRAIQDADGNVDDYYVRDLMRVRDNEMASRRELIDRGYRDYRANYNYRVQELPHIEDVVMYRTVAEMTRER